MQHRSPVFFLFKTEDVQLFLTAFRELGSQFFSPLGRLCAFAKDCTPWHVHTTGSEEIFARFLYSLREEQVAAVSACQLSKPGTEKEGSVPQEEEL